MAEYLEALMAVEYDNGYADGCADTDNYEHGYDEGYKDGVEDATEGVEGVSLVDGQATRAQLARNAS